MNREVKVKNPPLWASLKGWKKNLPVWWTKKMMWRGRRKKAATVWYANHHHSVWKWSKLSHLKEKIIPNLICYIFGSSQVNLFWARKFKCHVEKWDFLSYFRTLWSSLFSFFSNVVGNFGISRFSSLNMKSFSMLTKVNFQIPCLDINVC